MMIKTTRTFGRRYTKGCKYRPKLEKEESWSRRSLAATLMTARCVDLAGQNPKPGTSMFHPLLPAEQTKRPPASARPAMADSSAWLVKLVPHELEVSSAPTNLQFGCFQAGCDSMHAAQHTCSDRCNESHWQWCRCHCCPSTDMAQLTPACCCTQHICGLEGAGKEDQNLSLLVRGGHTQNTPSTPNQLPLVSCCRLHRESQLHVFRGHGSRCWRPRCGRARRHGQGESRNYRPGRGASN